MILAALVVLLAFHWPVYYLEATDQQSDGVLFRRTVALNDEFTLQYTHAVTNKPVQETYQIMPNRRLLLKQMIDSSLGAAMKNKDEYDSEMTPDGLRIYNINRSFRELKYQEAMSDSDTDFELIIKGTKIPFSDFADDRTPVKIEIKRSPIWLYRIREIIH